jgi:hypothetical protein
LESFLLPKKKQAYRKNLTRPGKTRKKIRFAVRASREKKFYGGGRAEKKLFWLGRVGQKKKSLRLDWIWLLQTFQAWANTSFPFNTVEFQTTNWLIIGHFPSQVKFFNFKNLGNFEVLRKFSTLCFLIHFCSKITEKSSEIFYWTFVRTGAKDDIYLFLNKFFTHFLYRYLILLILKGLGLVVYRMVLK